MPNPQSMLTQLMDETTSPYESGNTFTYPSTPSQDVEADQPNRAAIMHYIVTGQMPTAETIPSNGPIERLGVMLGLRPTTRPVSSETKDRAQYIKGELGKQSVERNLGLEESALPAAQWFGGSTGQQMLKTAGAPQLAGAYPEGGYGKSQLGLMGAEAKGQQAQAQAYLAEARAAAAQGNMELAAQKLGLAQERLSLDQTKLENSPVQAGLQMLDKQEQNLDTMESKLVNPLTGEALPDTDPRVQRLAKRRALVDKQRRQYLTRLGLSMGDADESAPTAPPPAKKGVIPMGLFSK